MSAGRGAEQHDPAAMLAGEGEEAPLPGGVAAEPKIPEIEHDESESAGAQEQLCCLQGAVLTCGPRNVNDGERGQVDAAFREVRRVEGAAGGLDPGRGLPLGLGESDGADGRTQDTRRRARWRAPRAFRGGKGSSSGAAGSAARARAGWT